MGERRIWTPEARSLIRTSQAHRRHLDRLRQGWTWDDLYAARKQRAARKKLRQTRRASRKANR